MSRHEKLQFVWPKDGPKGRSGHRGFFGRLDNILTGRGPDVFLQRKGSSSPIRPDFWGNWDSYHEPLYHDMEENGRFVSRGTKRYDPETRRYTRWGTPHDWYGVGVNAHGPGAYPRFTRQELRRVDRILRQGRRVDPARMGEDWTQNGPRRFQQQHDWFWQEAHRLGENNREGLHPLSEINPHLIMHQRWPDDVETWMRMEGLGRR